MCEVSCSCLFSPLQICFDKRNGAMNIRHGPIKVLCFSDGFVTALRPFPGDSLTDLLRQPGRFADGSQPSPSAMAPFPLPRCDPAIRGGTLGNRTSIMFLFRFHLRLYKLRHVCQYFTGRTALYTIEQTLAQRPWRSFCPYASRHRWMTTPFSQPVMEPTMGVSQSQSRLSLSVWMVGTV